jgi:hypothetical protein
MLNFRDEMFQCSGDQELLDKYASCDGNYVALIFEDCTFIPVTFHPCNFQIYPLLVNGNVKVFIGRVKKR